MNEKKSFYVIGMSCAGCAANIQQALSERKGVIEARVNFAASDVIVEYNPTLVSDKDLQKTVQEAGYDLLLENETEPEQAEILQREAYDKLRRKTIGALLLSLPVFVIGPMATGSCWDLPYRSYWYSEGIFSLMPGDN